MSSDHELQQVELEVRLYQAAEALARFCQMTHGNYTIEITDSRVVAFHEEKRRRVKRHNQD